MISSDVIRGYNDTIILYLLLEDSSYGYEISKNIRRISEDKYVIKETTLYSAVSRMEKHGYIRSYSDTGENGKKRTYYRITDEGRNYYLEKCSEWDLTKEVIDRFISDNLDQKAPSPAASNSLPVTEEVPEKSDEAEKGEEA
ncbi:MAG: PadR family transcriptional regulator [Eubacterium sp.]|nr:PadR family transcriptional regulator [Eubacterium sp.]